MDQNKGFLPILYLEFLVLTEKEKLYNTLKDKFNAFDKDESAQLGFPEYIEAWKVLEQPGTNEDIKKAFDSVDIDGSGKVEWNEYVFSLMGEDALLFSPMADLELLDQLIGDADKLLANLNSSIKESNKNRAERNAELRTRLVDMKNLLTGKMFPQNVTEFFWDAETVKFLNAWWQRLTK